MTSASDLRPYAGYTLPDAVVAELPNHYRGKVRENYDLPGGRRILIATDRMSAFDVNLAVIPLKGQVLTQTARFWFEATKDICANHVLDYPDPNVLALLWHFLFTRRPVAYRFSAVWTALWRWPSEHGENGAPYGGQSWLGWWAGDCFFSALLLRDGGAAGRRRQSSS